MSLRHHLPLAHYSGSFSRVEPLLGRMPLASLADTLLATIYVWSMRRTTRRALAELAKWDAHLLADIGLSRAEAFREAAKPFWRR